MFGIYYDVILNPRSDSTWCRNPIPLPVVQVGAERRQPVVLRPLGTRRWLLEISR